MMFHTNQWLTVVLGAALWASNHHHHFALANENAVGILKTMAPTESPAPSPSPSEFPTDLPTGTAKPTISPSAAPTESPEPSPSPSEFPTDAPTVSTAPSTTPSVSMKPSVSPSKAPSSTPTLSAQPSSKPSISSMPSDVPSQIPSDYPSSVPSAVPSDAPSSAPSTAPSSLPSASPTDVPSTSPSAKPTSTPSASPSDIPSATPSAAPSPVPTAVSMKTKTALTTVMLDGIVESMQGTVLGKFEIETRDHIEDTFPNYDEFEVKIMAVTVINQTVVVAPETPEQDGNQRALSSTTSGLQVTFRTIGVVESGVATPGFDFNTDIDAGFDQYTEIYFNRLSTIDPYFETLATDDGSDKEGKTENRTQFVIAILCASSAFGIAVFASYYSIKKHLETKEGSRRNASLGNKPMLSITDDERYPTRSMSYDKEESNNISSDENNQNLHVTVHEETFKNPRSPSIKSFVMRGNDDNDDRRTVMSPLSPNTLEKGGAQSIMDDFTTATGATTPNKKWLTPRNYFGSSEKKKSKHAGTPHSSSFSMSRTSLRMSDPPENEATAAARRKSSIEPDARKIATTASFKPKKLDTIETEAISKSKTGPGKKADATPKNPTPMNFGTYTPMGSAVGSTISGFFKQAGAVFGSGTKAEPEATEAKPKGQSSFDQGKETVIAYYQSSEAGGSEYYSNTSSSKSNPQMQQENGRASLGYSEYSEYSEFTEDFVESAKPKAAKGFQLGARPMDPNAMEEVSLASPVASNVNPSTIGARNNNARSQPSPSGYHQYPRHNNKKIVFRETTGKTGHLGARPMQDRKATDNSSKAGASQRAGAYDVFAPPGPIGIVVDTSKEGPAVHSLKSTSPMLGLITPGDLIIALDDEDTSNMTAASLTKLMAKKSRQSERKITLVSMD